MDHNFFEYFSVIDLGDAFLLGICFVIWVELFMTFTDFIYSVFRSLHQKRVLHFCALRYFTEDPDAFAPCHERSCPHRSMCEFWEPRPSLWSRLRNWFKRK